MMNNHKSPSPKASMETSWQLNLQQMALTAVCPLDCHIFVEDTRRKDYWKGGFGMTRKKSWGTRLNMVKRTRKEAAVAWRLYEVRHHQEHVFHR